MVPASAAILEYTLLFFLSNDLFRFVHSLAIFQESKLEAFCIFLEYVIHFLLSCFVFEFPQLPPLKPTECFRYVDIYTVQGLFFTA